MGLDGIPLFSLLQNKLGYLNERQKVIAQNVANSSTPGYMPHDLKGFAEQPGMSPQSKALPRLAPIGVAQTSAMHLAGSEASAAAVSSGKSFVNTDAPDSETTLNGNQVVLEEQMMKMSEARTDYDAAVGLYQKALGMLHLAVQKPGG
jgi:flagellar basal-body rod protein FlgB